MKKRFWNEAWTEFKKRYFSNIKSLFWLCLVVGIISGLLRLFSGDTSYSKILLAIFTFIIVYLTVIFFLVVIRTIKKMNT